MPFTFSHPALVIPLLCYRQRWPWLSATGLVAGSLAPDFEKFFRLKLASDYSHTVASLFYFSCPVGLALALIFHGLVRRPLLQHLPASLYYRLAKWTFVNWPAFVRRHPLGVLASIWLGAALHLLWDSFTHKNPFLTQYLPWLERVVALPYYHVYTYSFLALLSSVGGGLAMAWAVWQLPSQPVGLPPTAAAMWRYWGTVALVAVGLLSGWVLATHPSRPDATIAAFAAAMAGVLAVSIGAVTGKKKLTLQ